MNKYPQSELFEKLADIEHQRWADWQKYMHSKFYELGADKPEISLNNHLKILPTELWNRWERQISKKYPELSEKEKDSDRDQVMRYWKLIFPDEV
jgi:hypothetical protein